ncbi:hypothetical protein AGOR_G00194460 [Albula goreensis]|uniref:Uncharacterized protein n=1 Tax=Albula goreensis TaxID=1534307 RepID=A0A8T3CZJ5_9TELE|nr:hypothetical protein AGOR_G00194460 [Albula goreensis]
MSIIFHKQLTSIMEVLTTAAIGEICKLVDDGYAVLRLEMTQRVKENEALRRKLQMMEQQVSRAGSEATEARDSSANSDLPVFEVQVCTESRGRTNEGCFQTVGRAVGKRSIGCLRTGGQCTPVTDGEQPTISAHKLMQCADMEEGRTESFLIKEEKLEEESDPLGELNSGEQRAVEWRPGSGERPPVQEVQNKAANHTEELSEQHRTRHGVWEVSGPEPVLKAEAETESAHQGLQHRGTELRAGGLDSLDSAEFVMFDRPGQLETYPTEGSTNTETEDPCCSFSTEKDSQSLSFHSELQFTPKANDTARTSPALGACDMKPELVAPNSSPIKLEPELHATWKGETVSEVVYTERGRYQDDRLREAAQMVDSVFRLCPPHGQTTGGGNTTMVAEELQRNFNPELNGGPAGDRSIPILEETSTE